MKNKLFKTTFFALAIAVLSSCAGTYNSVNPERMVFNQSRANVDPVSFSYKYNVLSERRNKKYAKKELRKSIKLTAVEFTNNTNKPLVIGTDIAFYSGDKRLFLLTDQFIYDQLKQKTGGYFFYLLLSILTLNTYDEDGNVNVFPIGLILGPGITLGNVLAATSANNNFEYDLSNFNVDGKTLNPGETLKGLAGFLMPSYDPLTVRIIEN